MATKAKSTAAKPERPPLRPLLVGADGMAELLSCSREHIFALEAEGLIPSALRLSDARRWPLAVVEAWVACGCPRMAPPKEKIQQ